MISEDILAESVINLPAHLIYGTLFCDVNFAVGDDDEHLNIVDSVWSRQFVLQQHITPTCVPPSASVIRPERIFRPR